MALDSDDEDVPLNKRAGAQKRKADAQPVPGQRLKFNKKKTSGTIAADDTASEQRSARPEGFLDGLAVPAFNAPPLASPAKVLREVQVLEPSGWPFAGSRYNNCSILLPANAEAGSERYILDLPEFSVDKPWRAVGSIGLEALKELFGHLQDKFGRGKRYGTFEMRPELPEGRIELPENIRLMRDHKKATVVLFEKTVLFLAYRTVAQDIDVVLPATPAEETTLVLLAVSREDAKLAGCDFGGALDYFGVSTSRTSRNVDLLKPLVLRNEAFLRWSDLPSLGLDGKSYFVFSTGDDDESQMLINSLERLNAVKFDLSSNVDGPGPKLDFVFIAKRHTCTAIAAKRLLQWLKNSTTRFFEFDYANFGGDRGKFIREIWPRTAGVVAWTYQGLLDAGYDGVAAVMKWIVSKIPDTQSINEANPTPPYISIIPASVLRRLGKAAMATDVSPKERSQAAHALTALCLAHSAITLEGLTETKLDWIWQDAEFLLIPSLSLPDVQGVDASCTTMMQYLLAERYERGDFFVIGQPDGADALSGAHAMASVEEFLKAQGGH